jgi:hypothetical protein
MAAPYHTADIDVEGLLVVLRRDLLDRPVFDEAGVGENDIDDALLRRDDLIQPVQVGEVGDVTFDGGDIPSDRRLGLIELGLTSPVDVDIGALLDEAFGRRQADAAAAAGDDGYLVLQLRDGSPLRWVDRRACVTRRPARRAFKGCVSASQ